jgi:sporulation protein YlmC with PRC-barrel domain
MMKLAPLKLATLAATAMILLAPVANAQTTTVAPAAVTVIEPATVMKGYRASKIVGMTLTNEANETVGKIDDLVIRADDKAIVAIVSVGGFLGVGDRLVAVPYQSISWRENTGVLPGATKDRLNTFPEFKYAAR